MNEFKVGDWVTTKAGYTKQISGLTRDACDTLSIGNTSVGINVVFKNEIEFWQPEIGEWCWFRFDNHSSPELGQFKEMFNGDLFCSKQNDNDAFQFCEPFFGELPSFFKDQK